MGMNITYPANIDEWYATGTFENGVYFEVPAVFNADGTCNVPETDAKIEQFRMSMNARP